MAKTIKVRSEVADFAVSMEEILRENTHKGGWQNDSLVSLIKKLEKALNGLSLAIYMEAGDIGKEATDVANYAMMIHDTHRRLSKGEAK